jgi:hypothetical protein
MSLKVVPVAVERLSNLVCASLPQVRADRVTGEIRTDRATGQPQYEVWVLALVEGEREPSVMQVRVPGEPVGLEIGRPVKLFDLVERKWEMDGRSGVTYSASAITAAAPQVAQAPESQSAGKAPGGRGAVS